MIAELKENLIKLSDEINHLILDCLDLKTLDEIRVNSLGKKGSITAHLKNLRDYDEESKKEIGSLVNEIKFNINKMIEQKSLSFKKNLLNERINSEKIDVTLTSQDRDLGTLHPLSRTIEELCAIFADMGFSIVDGPDIETDYYNFTALNIPKEHPARQEHDTFYLLPDKDGNRKVLRTHTSPVQIRTMEKLNLKEFDEIRYIIPGRTYRSDHDATHSPMFHQCEGLVLGKDINMGHLKGCLIEFCRSYFNEENLPVRFRPSYFPFTEPSAEVDIGCRKEKDGSLSIGEGEDWLEILGSGMIHPRVLEGIGIDPNVYQGFAFGMGLERLTMLKYGIPDLRPFYDSDLRWLKHYGFIPVDNPSLHSGLNGVFS